MRAVERASLHRGTEGTKDHFTSQASVHGICGEQSRISTDFLSSTVKLEISGTAWSIKGGFKPEKRRINYGGSGYTKYCN